MGVLARGSVTDRPWGMTLGALGLRGLTGQLTLADQYRVAFEQGAVVGAYSPLANDSVVRLALTGNLITSSQVSDITRRLAAAPLRDEVEVLAEACRLQPDQAHRLRRRLVAQRAARTFAVNAGEFVVEEQITVAVVPGSELDGRSIVFLGAMNSLSEERLVAELGQLGVWFKLKPDAIEDLPQYGFTEDDKPVLQLLVQGANLADIEHAHMSLGARAVRAVTYSLAVCGACEASANAGPALPRVQTSSVPPETVPRTQTQQRAPSITVPPAPRPRSPTMQPSTPTETATPPVGETKQHKTAPLGSRSPSAGSSPPATAPARPLPGRAPTQERTSAYGGLGPDPSLPRTATPHDVAMSRVATPHESPRGPRTITQSSGVPRESDSRNSSGATAAKTGSFGAVRSPSGTMPAQDRSPSGGIRSGGSGAHERPSATTRAQDRSPSAGVRVPERGSSANIPRPRSPTARAGSQTNSPPLTARTTTASSGAQLRPPADGAGAGRPRSTSSAPMRSFTTQAPPLRAPAKLPTRRAKQSTGATMEIEALLMKKIPMLDQGVDYFTLFGLPIGAPPDAVRSTYFMLARKLHPDRLSAIGIEDEDRQAQRLMECINEAFSILNDPVGRE